jgi:hypothetical protein
VEWLKVKALSSSPSTAKKKKKNHMVLYKKYVILYVNLKKEKEQGILAHSCNPSTSEEEAGES